MLPLAMERVTDNVWRLTVRGNFVNVYVIEDVLIDAGMPWDGSGLLAQLTGHELAAHAITHAHPDHMGSSHELCERLAIPFWAGEHDVAVAEDPGLMATDLFSIPAFGLNMPRNPISDMVMKALSGPGHKVDRALHQGDVVGGFEVIDTPGHTRGHVSLWRDSDRVLIVGDALWNLPRLMPPVAIANVDNAAVHDSIRKLAALKPAVACFGHGPVLRDPDKLSQLAAELS
jgi:glyoxylase-like metal-dependent hydrolase (beta-lactamase superfamily II)